MDMMDQMDMPQWQQNNHHGTHVVMAEGNTRLGCEKPKLWVTHGLSAKDQADTRYKALNNHLAEATKFYTMPAVINPSLPKGGGQEGEENC